VGYSCDVSSSDSVLDKSSVDSFLDFFSFFSFFGFSETSVVEDSSISFLEARFFVFFSGSSSRDVSRSDSFFVSDSEVVEDSFLLFFSFFNFFSEVGYSCDVSSSDSVLDKSSVDSFLNFFSFFNFFFRGRIFL